MSLSACALQRRAVAKAATSVLIAGVISSGHHVYGALLYDTPWRLVVSLWIPAFVMLVLSSLLIALETCSSGGRHCFSMDRITLGCDISSRIHDVRVRVFARIEKTLCPNRGIGGSMLRLARIRNVFFEKL